MSRNSRPHPMNGTCRALSGAASDNEDNFRITECAAALYGSDAPTAVAYCALEAWCEGNQDEYQLWLDVFRRLRN